MNKNDKSVCIPEAEQQEIITSLDGIATTDELEKNILLELARDISRVREKDDLIRFISNRLKAMCHFTHTIVTLIDHSEEIYKPFLLNHESSPIRDHHEYKKLIVSKFSLDDPFIQEVLLINGAATFTLAEIKDNPKSPPFLRINYERGSREIMMTTLWNAEIPIGFIHMYNNTAAGFAPEIRNLISTIAPLISIAVQNIIKNEELLNQEEEKSFLLDFSNDIAAVRNKEELEEAVRIALKEIYHIQDYAIRIIDHGTNTTALYFSNQNKARNEIELQVREEKFPINDGLQNRVLDSYIPLLFNVNIEMNRGITSNYLLFWKEMGYQWIVGTALRHGDVNLGILWLAMDEVKISLLQGICAQISTAMANIMANDELVKINNDQSVLLTFSNEIAGVRNKNDLEAAIIKVLRNVLDTKLAMINIFEKDGVALAPFIFDKTLFEFLGSPKQENEETDFQFDIYEYYIAKVIKSSEPLVFDIGEELKAKHSATFAKICGGTEFKNAYGALLRVGNTNIGTLWLLADALDGSILKGICSQISIALANILANDTILDYKQQLEKENVYLKEQIKNMYNFNEIIGNAHQMQKVYNLMSLVAESNSTVLVLGETGTGKELIARALHNSSPRKDKLMIKVNCAAMPASLIESELFGHEKGAFTGALERRIGKFELAHQSTLFLDEIGEMPLEAQVKLLRVLQERELERVGGKDTIKVDVRIVAATNRDLEEEVKAGRFRSDLFYRLNVFPIQLPPLRDRMEDIEALTNFFIDKYSRNTGRKIVSVSARAIQQLYSYHWPGNIRELEHLIERSVLMTSDQVLREVHLPKKGETAAVEDIFCKSLEEMEKTFIINALRRFRGKISGVGGAAEALGIPGNTLHSKMNKLGINKADYFV